jgi:hypothetical protein
LRGLRRVARGWKPRVDASARDSPADAWPSSPSGCSARSSRIKMGWTTSGNMALAFSVVLFLTVAWYHNRLEDRLHRLHRWQGIKQVHLARMHLTWSEIPLRPITVPERHGYARDLDLAGPHSLLHLIDNTISSQGRQRLTSWFLDQPPPNTPWRSRQTPHPRTDAPGASPGPVDPGGASRGRRGYRRPPAPGRAPETCRRLRTYPHVGDRNRADPHDGRAAVRRPAVRTRQLLDAVVRTVRSSLPLGAQPVGGNLRPCPIAASSIRAAQRGARLSGAAILPAHPESGTALPTAAAARQQARPAR